MEYYPIFLNVAGRRCLIVGGGAVAERKAGGLLKAGASVTVISPGLTNIMESWAEEKKLRHIRRDYRSGDLAGHQLAFVATDNPEVKSAVYGEAQERGVLINAADDPARCDFILPSVLRRGELVVAVATGGSSPALAKAIRRELEHYFTQDYAILSEIVAEVRRELKQRGRSAGPEIWGRALNGSLRRLVRQGDIEGAKRYLREHMGA